MFQHVKSLDEKRSNCTSISSLFSDNLTASREKLVILIESILLEDFEQIGKKTREILWRKVYYDPVSTSKKIWKKSSSDLCVEEALLLNNFIKCAIRHYKTLILKFEDIFNLDLRYIIDFSIIANEADAFEKRTEKEMYTKNETNHALETIYCFLICLGDLHRYCIEFKLSENDISNKLLAVRYYNEAFKLNPRNGVSHNQLGTLVGGENFDIEAIFHYIYSLCSPIPAELSEANVNRIFQHNVEALEQSSSPSIAPGEFNVKQFMQQVILVIDIFFYDKEISEFNTLCYSVLVNFKEYLRACRRNSQADLSFHITSIFMLCLLKLKMNNSPKVHNLNAFLIAFCAEIVDRTLAQMDEFIADHKNENLEFMEQYNKRFYDFDKKVRQAREIYRSNGSVKAKEKDSGVEKNGSGSSNSLKEGSSSNHLSSGESKLTLSEASLSQPGQIKIAKRPDVKIAALPQNTTTTTTTSITAVAASTANNHNRRRRKRRGISGSSSDESETESLFSDDEESMNSDFDSYDEDDDYVGMHFSSDEDDHDHENSIVDRESDGDDIVIENEEIIFSNEAQQDEIKCQESPDFLIEEETIVFKEDQPDEEMTKLLKMNYKKKYTKINPNMVLEFSELYSPWIQSLKILFNWLRLNNEILLDCYRSNPEFVRKIMKLINFLNIDIFTRKIFFERSMITLKNMRDNLRSLFDNRHNIATTEDIVFKKFSLFEELQQSFDWNLNYKLQITSEEDIALRDFHIIDFGFYLCKQKKFNFSFCARSREFIEKQSRSRGERRRRERNGETRDGKERDSKRRNRRGRNRRRDRDRERKHKPSECEQFERLSIKTHSQDSQFGEFPSLQQVTRKGYLRNKEASNNEGEKKLENNKEEMMGKMGKLWLKNEVKTLESRSRPTNANLTPYIMVDTFALIDYLYIVKHLVKSKKFVVLIPKAGESIIIIAFVSNHMETRKLIIF